MTRLEIYKERLDKLYVKKDQLNKAGKYIQANNLHKDILEIEKLIKEAEEYEEACKPRPVVDMVSQEELNQMGIIPLMIECHLIADMLTEVSYMIADKFKEYGFQEIEFMPELQDIIKKSDKFASFLTDMSEELKGLLVRNETLNASLHKKYTNYIEQRLKHKKQS